MHPFAPDMSTLTDDEVLKKIDSLYTKLRQSYYMADPTIRNQINLLISDYQEEYNKRMAIQAEKFAQQHSKLTEKIITK